MQKSLRQNQQTLLRILILAFFTSSLLACQGRTTDTNPTGDIQVRIPMNQGDQYTMSNVNLTSVRDITNFSGEAAHFLLSPNEIGNEVHGIEPFVRTVRNSAGVYIATDNLSLQVMTLYAHFERLYFLDQAMGVSDYVQLKWPRQVAVNARMTYEDGRVAVDNALYKPKFDTYYFTRFKADTLPLSVNAGVIAHEHFHAIFHQLVMIKNLDLFAATQDTSPHGPDRGSTSEKLRTHSDWNRFLARGLNEGLADVWGWIYSNDEKFVSRSMPHFSGRDLDVPVTVIRSHPQTDIYAYGSAHARLLVSYAKAELAKGQDLSTAKKKLAQALLKTLSQWSGLLKDQEKKESLVEDKAFLDLLNGNLSGISQWYESAIKKKP